MCVGGAVVFCFSLTSSNFIQFSARARFRFVHEFGDDDANTVLLLVRCRVKSSWFVDKTSHMLDRPRSMVTMVISCWIR